MKQKLSTTIGTVLLLTVFVSLFPHALSAQSFPGKARDNATVDFQTYLESRGVTGDKALDAASRFQTAYDSTSGNTSQSARTALQGAGLDPNLANGYLGTASQIQTAQQQIDNRNVGGNSGCGWSRDSWSLCLAWVFHALLVQTTGLFTYVAGQIFNVAVGFGLDSKSFNVDIVEKGWVIIRDIANMSFIFVLIYIAVKTILNMAGSDTKGLIAKVIVVALLINFSLFFAKFVIDVGNILAIQFYDKISVGGGAVTDISKGGKTFAPTQVKDISGVVASGVNAQKLLQDKQFQEFFKKSDTSFFENLGVFFLLMLAFAVVNIMLAFVFIAAAFQFIARVLGLWVVMIMAPAAFVAYIIPGWSKWSDRWWSELIRLTFYAPVFMFVFYIALLFITGGQQSGGGLLANVSQQIQAIRADGTTFGTTANIIAVVFMNAAIVVGLLFAALKVASLMSTTLSTTIGGFIGKIGYGAGGFAGRNTFGRLAYGLGQSRLFQGTSLGKFINRRALQPLATGSFDMRGAPLGLGGALGKEVGSAGGKGGFEKVVKEKIDAEKTFLKKLEPSVAQKESIDRKRRSVEKALRDKHGHENASNELVAAAQEREATGAELNKAQIATGGARNAFNEAQGKFQEAERVAEEAISSGVVAAARIPLEAAREEARRVMTAAQNELRSRQEAQRTVRDRLTAAEARERQTKSNLARINETVEKEVEAAVPSAKTIAQKRKTDYAKSLEWFSPSAVFKLPNLVTRAVGLGTVLPETGTTVRSALVRDITKSKEDRIKDDIEELLSGGKGGGKKEEKKEEEH